MDIEQWKFINTFAPWFSALGTLGAVILSLYLAFIKHRPKLIVKADLRLLIGEGDEPPYPEYIIISAVNAGDKDITINTIGWKSGVIRKKYAIQNPDIDPYTTRLPATIKHGERAQWFFQVQETEKAEVEEFINNILTPLFLIKLNTLKA